MAYIGQTPLIGDYKKLDNLTSQFNSANTTFNLTVSGEAVTPGTPQALIISLAGSILNPGVAYFTEGSTIRFASAPATSAAFFGTMLGSTQAVGVPTDGTITASKLSTTGVTANTYGGTTAIPVFTVDATGRLSSASNVSITSGATLTIDNSTNFEYVVGMANAVSGAWTTAYVSNTKLYFNPSTGTLSATSFNNLSDASEKINISVIADATGTVRQLEGVEFDWKNNGKKSAGVIAQELEKILPHLVTENQNGLKSVNYSGIIGYLIQTVKELDNRIKVLETK